MVPRFGINEHMDETCCRNHGKSGVIDSTLNSFRNGSPPAANANSNSSSYFSKKLLNLETSPSKSSLLKAEGNATPQISPYFSSNSSVCSVNNEPRIQTVKVVSLGSLSSKLSRRRSQGGKQIVYKEIDSSPPAVHNMCKSAAAQDDDEIYDGNSSQKENHLALREHQEQKFSKEEPEFQEETNKCNGEDLVDIVQISLPADNINSKRLPIATRSTKPESMSEGLILSPDKFETHLAICTSAELTNSLEVKTQPHTQVIPSSKTEVNCGTQNCFSKADVQLLPMEVYEDFEDEINHTLSETVEKVEFQNSIGDILHKINEVSSVPGSPGHPYYLQNFLAVLRAVLENEDDVRLFDEQDMNVIAKFCKLSVGGQKLYVRLFQRKLNWLKVNKIEYGEISTDLSPIIEELAEARFLQTESELEDLCEGLDLLSAPELKALAKVFHLPNPNGQKQQLVDDFLRLAKQRSVFSKSQAGIGTVILKRVKDLAGKSVRVCKGPRAVFSRILLLFSLSESMEDEEAGSAGQGQLSTVLMVNMGRMVFPSYTVNRKTQVFQDREDLIRYATAAHLSNDIGTAMVTIKGKMCPQMGMGKSVFLMEDIGDEEGGEDFSVSTVMCSVEELALTHYRRNGFDQDNEPNHKDAEGVRDQKPSQMKTTEDKIVRFEA
ncbi:fanconi-associated nuclease 1 [Limosa lapponica baueri]|uniref:Fanconi-associated nuclease n=1 Tax=Limosa lapponica baueri TaxID=1758121 RepID=A0A2I0U5X1_LIMLA|nr:fanconi-associated nuclease 1 [Limosa lapponica baueri]